jgi:hypothetical protein
LEQVEPMQKEESGDGVGEKKREEKRLKLRKGKAGKEAKWLV